MSLKIGALTKLGLSFQWCVLFVSLIKLWQSSCTTTRSIETCKIYDSWAPCAEEGQDCSMNSGVKFEFTRAMKEKNRSILCYSRFNSVQIIRKDKVNESSLLLGSINNYCRLRSTEITKNDVQFR